MTSDATPGPWTIEKRSATTAILHKPTDSIIGEVYGRIHGKGIEDANARLIAAAPELLDRLEKNLTLMIGLHGCDDLGDFYANRVSEELAATRAIIAKAAGV